MTRFIDEHRGRFGVERICRVMGTNVSTYYAHKSRPPSARTIQDEWLRELNRPRQEPYAIHRVVLTPVVTGSPVQGAVRI
jgi:putative transposase